MSKEEKIRDGRQPEETNPAIDEVSRQLRELSKTNPDEIAERIKTEEFAREEAQRINDANDAEAKRREDDAEAHRSLLSKLFRRKPPEVPRAPEVTETDVLMQMAQRDDYDREWGPNSKRAQRIREKLEEESQRECTEAEKEARRLESAPKNVKLSEEQLKRNEEIRRNSKERLKKEVEEAEKRENRRREELRRDKEIAAGDTEFKDGDPVQLTQGAHSKQWIVRGGTDSAGKITISDGKDSLRVEPKDVTRWIPDPHSRYDFWDH